MWGERKREREGGGGGWERARERESMEILQRLLLLTYRNPLQKTAYSDDNRINSPQGPTVPDTSASTPHSPLQCRGVYECVCLSVSTHSPTGTYSCGSIKSIRWCGMDSEQHNGRKHMRGRVPTDEAEVEMK